MTRIKRRALLFLAVLAGMHMDAQKTPQLGKDPIEKVIKAMTPEEKASMLIGSEMHGAVLDGQPRLKVPGAAGGTYPIKRLGIPALVLADGPAGIRIDPKRPNDPKTYYATAFPVGTALAATWNRELIEQVGSAIGKEVKEYGADILLAPGVNIHRNPLNGRNFEYYSEDPLVAGEIAASYIKGVQSNGVGTSIKHFAANNQETNRLTINEHISQRAMREIYLKAFQIAVKKSQPWTVMSSYNKINGQYTSQRRDLLTDILRTEWGFKGFVMSDWFGGYESFASIGTTSSNVIAQVEAGNDLMMPGMKLQHEMLVKAIKDGTISTEAVDGSIKRILEVTLQSPVFKKYKYSSSPDLKSHATITRLTAAEAMVLLKNESGILPYTPQQKPAAVFGITSYNFISGGTGSGDVNEAYSVSLLEGLKSAGYAIDQQLADLYIPFVKLEAEKESDRREKSGGILAVPKKMPELELQSDLINTVAQSSDIAIITIGRNSGENDDRRITADFYLAQDEISLINKVAAAFHSLNKKVIVILNIGGVIETASWKDKADAIITAWLPGQEGGNSVADVISGKVNPSGKLPMTFARDYNNYPSAANWLGTPASDPKEVSYEEGIYVGYRFFNTFDVKPSYEFGYGQSYTAFKYSGIKSDSSFENEINAEVTVTNTGQKEGKEIVQLYLSAPALLSDKPAQELKGFAKTKNLKPGESQTLKFKLQPEDLASFIENRKAWIAESGDYTISIGASSNDIKDTAGFHLAKEITVEKVHDSFPLDSVLNETQSR